MISIKNWPIKYQYQIIASKEVFNNNIKILRLIETIQNLIQAIVKNKFTIYYRIILKK